MVSHAQIARNRLYSLFLGFFSHLTADLLYYSANMSTPSPHTSMMQKVLRPLVRLLLRNGVAYADFSAVARRIFVEVASEDFGLPGRKQSVSRVSVLTGVNRKEVKRLLEEPVEKEPAGKENNRAARVVSAWMRDSDFRTTAGKPRVLGWGDPQAAGSFEDLVKRYSGDMTARAILDELLRVGSVSINDKKSKVTLVSNGYVPAGSDEELLRLSGNSINDMLNTIDHNFSKEAEVTRLQLSVAYDDVPANGVELFRERSNEKSLELLKDLDQFLAKQDRTVNPSVKGEGRYRTGVGIYYFEEPVVEPEDAELPVKDKAKDDAK